MPTRGRRTSACAKRSATLTLLVAGAGWTMSSGLTRAQPAASPVEDGAASATLREGTFIVDRVGQAVRREAGGWVFAFDPSAEQAALPPMILEPSLNLMALQRLVEGRGASTRFRVSGEVFVHRGRNYLLLTRYEAIAPQAEQAAEPAAQQPAPELPPPTPATDEPSVAELVAALDRATPQREAGAVAPMRSLSGRNAGDEAHARLLREGTMLFSRVGRVVRDAGGGYAFVVDVDADSAANADPPLRLAPSLATMALEAAAEAVGGDLPVVISGRALLYEGRNYLLPSVFRIRRPALREITTAQ